jgi:F-type H+-transporting ATPase subunit gamma
MGVPSAPGPILSPPPRRQKGWIVYNLTDWLHAEVVEGVAEPGVNEVLPLYEFEPDADKVLDALLPVYIESRIYNAMLQSAASEHASRQRAMKSASDNADKLIREYTRLANNARQSEITQQISEIVGGADALSDAK